MTSFIRKTIRACVAPKHKLSCSQRLWQAGLRELQQRTEGEHESGAFLLGRRHGKRAAIERFIYYDDLDPQSLDSGIVVFDGAGYGPLWQLCRETGLEVVADIHVHGGSAHQSTTDRANPMIAQPGHIALIVPDLAKQVFAPTALGIYEYLGEHRWTDWSGKSAAPFFYVGYWG